MSVTHSFRCCGSDSQSAAPQVPHVRRRLPVQSQGFIPEDTPWILRSRRCVFASAFDVLFLSQSRFNFGDSPRHKDPPECTPKGRPSSLSCKRCMLQGRTCCASRLSICFCTITDVQKAAKKTTLPGTGAARHSYTKALHYVQIFYESMRSGKLDRQRLAWCARDDVTLRIT